MTHVALGPYIQERVIVRRIGQDAHPLVVLGRRPEEGDTSDIDLLDGLRKRAAWLRDGGGKGIEIADDDGDLGDGLVCEVTFVGRDRTRENPCGVHLRYRPTKGGSGENGYLHARLDGAS